MINNLLVYNYNYINESESCSWCNKKSSPNNEGCRMVVLYKLFTVSLFVKGLAFCNICLIYVSMANIMY